MMKKKEAESGKGGCLRLDKYLADMGLGSRSQIREGAKKGKIRVNGEVEKDAGRKINPLTESVTWDGREVAYTALEYYMLNKPKGVVSATEDRIHRTVVDLITDRQRKDLFPVGRLDIDTEGLLLITNDGELAHRLLSPKRHVDKIYYAEVEGTLPEDASRRFEDGIVLKDGTKTMPAALQILDGAVLLTIREGKFHQVKRMFEILDCKVTYLKRISMGSLRLDESLKPGQYRPLTAQEIEALRKAQTGEAEQEEID